MEAISHGIRNPSLDMCRTIPRNHLTDRFLVKQSPKFFGIQPRIGKYFCCCCPNFWLLILYFLFREFFIFSGGMPRASYGDKEAVSIIFQTTESNTEKNQVLDFTSKVVDFALITSGLSSCFTFCNIAKHSFYYRGEHSQGAGCVDRRGIGCDRSDDARLASIQTTVPLLFALIPRDMFPALHRH